MGVIGFLGSTAGRWTRSLIGVVLLVLAVVVGGGWAWVLGVLGVVFVAVGLFDICLLAPLFRLPLKGRDIRARTSASAS
jgi:hypothetical protein